MKFIGKIIILILLATGTVTVFAQEQTKEQLALQYYQNGEFDKAVVLFQELFEKNRNSIYYYSYYFDCLIRLKDYNTAENVLKKLIKKNPGVPEYSVDLGYVYSLDGDTKKKKTTWDNVLKNIPPDEDMITKTANAFIIRGEKELAVEVYLKGRKMAPDRNFFALQLAELYQELSRPEEMISEYLRLLDDDPGQLATIEDRLQDFVFKEENYEKVRITLISEVQKNDYNPVYVRLLSWLFIQKKDFESAFIQLKSLDKRYDQNNILLIQLADVCIANLDWEVAEDIYRYVVEKGNRTPYFYHARYGLLEVSYQKLVSKPLPLLTEIENLEKEYSEYLQNSFYQNIEFSEKILLRLAELKAVYEHKPAEALSLLNQYINIPQLRPENKARIKMAMGDYEILLGNVWDASLDYSQVDFMAVDNSVRHEAKFRSAKLAFYMGNFEYAADLLEVLKGSTTDLIANDAIQLGLVIQDNIEEDSNLLPLQMYAKADFYFFKSQYDSADKMLDTLLSQYPMHTLTDDAWFEKAEIEFKRKNFEKSLELYKKVYSNYGQDILADDALYKSAIIYDKCLKQETKASELYEKIILDYPDSIYVVEARKRYREIRGS